MGFTMSKNDEIRIVEWTETVSYDYGRPGGRSVTVTVGRRLEWGDGSFIGYRFDAPTTLSVHFKRVVSDSIQSEIEAYVGGEHKRPMNDATLSAIAQIVDCNHRACLDAGLIGEPLPEFNKMSDETDVEFRERVKRSLIDG